MSVSDAQSDFLRRGGPMAGVLAQKYEKGELERETPFHEYPKEIRINHGAKIVTRHTTILRGNTEVPHTWDEEIEDIQRITVASEEEEERVLAGGKTAAQVEEQRQDMLSQAKRRGINADPSWGIVRLQRELGSAPTNETIEALQRQVADLEEKAALRRKIAELEAQIAGKPADDPDAMRAELTALGVKVDGRWSVTRLREELDRATAPTE
jgi:polyhydroxyalkanoate synthesis regulator phasin